MSCPSRRLCVVSTLFALALVIVSTACGPAAAPSTNLSGPPNLDAAKKEGKLTLYSATASADLEKLVQLFNKKYPDIKVETWRESSGPVAQKALTEFRANTPLADVIGVGDAETAILLSAGVLGQYKSSELQVYPAGAFDPDGYYAAEQLTVLVIAYNTNSVKKEDAPKKLEDLLDPKWAGKIGVEQDDYQLIAYTTSAMGEAQANDFWTKLAAQKVRVVSGHTELANAIVAGEIAISPTVFAHRVEALKAKKSPIDWVKADPVYALPQVISITKYPPHPNAAKLWIDWDLSEEGQTAMASLARIPARPGIKTNPEGILNGVNLFYGSPKLLGKRDELKAQYYKLFGIK